MDLFDPYLIMSHIYFASNKETSYIGKKEKLLVVDVSHKIWKKNMFVSSHLFSALSTTGIFMVEFIEYFQASKLYVSLISSLMMAMVAVIGKSKLLICQMTFVFRQKILIIYHLRVI